MINGTLIVNLDPPYLAFNREAAQQDGRNGCWQRYCTPAEIQALLLDLEAISPDQSWPIHEYQALLRGAFSELTLAKHGLGPVLRIEPSTRSERKRQLIGVSG